MLCYNITFNGLTDKVRNCVASRKGSPNRITKTVKEAVERAFQKVNHDGQYLIRVAESDPKTFLAICSKLIPAQVAVSVSHSLDLGAEMLIAAQNLNRLANSQANQIIDVTPTIDSNSDDSHATDSHKVLIDNDNTER